MKKPRACILTTFFLCALIAVYAQETTVTLSKYTQNEGLSSYFVTKIFQDYRGFMWVGTQEGLNLFDGRSFQVFSRQNENKTRLGGSFVSDILEDKKRNLLWVATTYGDVCAIDIDTRVVRTRISKDKDDGPLSKKWVRALAIHGDTLWIGGLSILSAFDINTNRFLPLDALTAAGMTAADCNISKLAFDGQNRLWIFSDGYGISVLDNKFQRAYSIRSELSNGYSQTRKLRFWDVAFKNNTFYAGTSWGLRVFDAVSRSINYLNAPTGSAIDTTEILCLAPDLPGRIFYSTPGSFCSYDFTSRKTQVYRDNHSEDDWLSIVYQLFYDPSYKKIWVGTQSGLATFNGEKYPFSAISRSSTSAVKLKHLYSLLPVNSNEVYCGDESGVFHVNTVTKAIEKIGEGSFNFMLFRDNDANVFLSNSNGLHTIKGKKTAPAWHSFPSLKELMEDIFNSAVQYNDSLILFGSVLQKGLTVWNNRTGSVRIFHNDSTNRIPELRVINNLFKGSAEQVHILTETSIISFNPLTRASNIHNIIIPGTSDTVSNFMDMCETGDSYWIATYGNGLIETTKGFTVKKIITTTGNLSNNCIYKVFPYRNSIIATSNNGLNIIDEKNYNIQRFYQSDGLHSSSFEQVCGYQAKDRIYAGGVNGFTIIDPTVLFTNKVPPKLFVNKVTIQTKKEIKDTSNILLERLAIPNNVLQVTIALSGLNYKNPERTVFSYRIKEEGDDWIYLGTQNFLNLLPSSPGTRTLLFRSANESGVWTKQPITIELHFLPKWYQTWWFRMLLVASVLGLLYAFYRYQLAQIRKRHEIRKNIASDLHDDIGSILNSVKIFTHLAKRQEDKSKYIDQIETSLTQASLGLRDIIWVLDDSRDSVQELMERVKKYALPVCIAKNVKFEGTINTDSSGNLLTKAQKRNLFLITKEGINNSLKHSGCRRIEVTISQNKSKISLAIQDDGQGFEANELTEGYGLKNIQQRAEQINATVTITSRPGEGTSIFISQA